MSKRAATNTESEANALACEPETDATGGAGADGSDAAARLVPAAASLAAANAPMKKITCLNISS